MIDGILLGLSVVLSLKGFGFLLAGCFLGTIIGVLPGLGTVATVAILFPYTYGLEPVYSLMMLAGIYYGAQYGGSNTSILINTPGEPSSIMTCVDGYQMTKQGLGGQAVVAAGISSLIAGVVTILIIAVLSPWLSSFALKFGPRELSLLMLLGLISISVITNKNIITGIAMASVGILLGTIGTDINTGVIRFTGNIPYLADGISIPVIAIGIFGIAEIFNNLLDQTKKNNVYSLKIKFSLSELKRIIPSSLRGTGVGSVFGLIPGGGAVMASFIAYALEKKVSKNKDQFGSGAIEGVSAPEAVNNAAAQTNFVPLLTLGIPENAVMSLILGVLIVAGVQPGPGMIERQPELFWGLLISMVFGNLILVILNIPLVKIWLRFLNIPKLIFYPILLIVSLTGVYFINNSMFEVGLSAVLGIFGFIFIKLGLEAAPLIFGFVIGTMFEEHFRKSMSIARGDFSYYFDGDISKMLLIIISAVMIFGIYKTIKNRF